MIRTVAHWIHGDRRAFIAYHEYLRLRPDMTHALACMSSPGIRRVARHVFPSSLDFGLLVHGVSAQLAPQTLHSGPYRNRLLSLSKNVVLLTMSDPSNPRHYFS